MAERAAGLLVARPALRARRPQRAGAIEFAVARVQYLRELIALRIALDGFNSASWASGCRRAVAGIGDAPAIRPSRLTCAGARQYAPQQVSGGTSVMAKIVLGVATSHTPMLNTPAKDWPSFIDRDGVREFLDKEGEPASYEELLTRADPRALPELTPERFAARHDDAMAAVDRLKQSVRRAELDALIIIGDDQKELFHEDHLPSILVYYGDTIRNVPLAPTFRGPEWSRLATARYYEEKEPRDYPVDAPLARYLIGELIDREFDIASSNGLAPGNGEGHAHAFVRKRLMEDPDLPVVPVFLNTYYPPNQPTPRRCWKLGQAIREAVESYPGDARIGIVGSGGLSHFVVDEELDRGVIEALGRKDGEALQSLPRKKLNSGSSEIRMWISIGGAVEHLDMAWSHYVPGYRTPAGSGTGLGFAYWC